MQSLIYKAKSLWYQLTHWEFWPFSLVYFPVYFYYTLLVIRCRSFFFFTAANPSIDFGGMLGESKSDIFDLIPQAYLPRYALIQPGDLTHARKRAQSIGYPIICKPDIGERGRLVERISNENELRIYVGKSPVAFLIQELVDLPIELGVFFIRHPDQPKGRITSIVQKNFLSVIGDGKHTVRELLTTNWRAALQLDFGHHRFRKIMNTVPDNGQQVMIEGIGNHCRGTTFINANHRITDKLNAAFNKLSFQIEGFYFGRFDLRCESFESLEELKAFKVLELNGAGAEPGHIYHPGASIWKGYRSIFWHLHQLALISQKNHEAGLPYWSFGPGIKKMRMVSKYNQKLNEAL